MLINHVDYLVAIKSILNGAITIYLSLSFIIIYPKEWENSNRKLGSFTGIPFSWIMMNVFTITKLNWLPNLKARYHFKVSSDKLESCNYIFKANLFIYQNESLDIRNEIEGSNGIEENDF